ncbi:MAG: hypothetical protein NC048_08610 [Bacteroides sp.]|nr:hypothetical protein [Ruminococcus flavefaciens]MCM1555540.1 hypothetical protein [Bacteroides sp.]
MSPQVRTDSVALDKVLDLSEEMNLMNAKPEYAVWSLADSNITSEYSETVGKFRFNRQGNYCIRLYNEDFMDNAYIEDETYFPYHPDSLQPVYVHHMVTVTAPFGEDPDTVVIPARGVGLIWQAQANREKEIEIEGRGGFTVDWGDGNTNTVKAFTDGTPEAKDSDKELKHRYAAAGIYTVQILPSDNKGYLTALEVSGEQVLALAVGDSTRLEKLDCSDNLIEALELGSLNTLKELDCSENRLTALDVSGCINLQDLDFSENKLREINLNGLGRIDEVDGEDNRMPLSTLYNILTARNRNATYEFDPQSDSANVAPNTPFDLTGEMTIGGKRSTYTLRYADTRQTVPNTDYKEENGIFQFYSNRPFILSLQNANVVEYDDGRPKKQITFTWHINTSGVANEGLNNSKTRLQAYVKEHIIHVQNAEGEITLYNTLGQQLYQGTQTEIPVQTSGLYIIKSGTSHLKVLVN